MRLQLPQKSPSATLAVALALVCLVSTHPLPGPGSNTSSTPPSNPVPSPQPPLPPGPPPGLPPGPTPPSISPQVDSGRNLPPSGYDSRYPQYQHNRADRDIEIMTISEASRETGSILGGAAGGSISASQHGRQGSIASTQASVVFGGGRRRSVTSPAPMEERQSSVFEPVPEAVYAGSSVGAQKRLKESGVEGGKAKQAAAGSGSRGAAHGSSWAGRSQVRQTSTGISGSGAANVRSPRRADTWTAKCLDCIGLGCLGCRGSDSE